MKRDASPQPQIDFKINQPDDLDELMKQKLAEIDCKVPVTKLGNGFYLFGTRKIFAKILNGKLVV